MAPQIAHRSVAEIPPSIPLRAWHIDGMEWTERRRTEPKVPIQPRGSANRIRRTLGDRNNVLMPASPLGGLQSPGARNPNMRLVHGADGVALDQLHHAPVILRRINL